jgi:hypothetical protein
VPASPIRLQRQTINMHYPDLKTLLRAVKDIGANSVGEGARSGLLGRSAWQRVQAAYESTPHARRPARALRRHSGLRQEVSK